MAEAYHDGDKRTSSPLKSHRHDGYKTLGHGVDESPGEGRWYERVRLVGGNRIVSRVLRFLPCCGFDDAADDEGTDDPRRTLSTFAGVFAPVALSMFSTLLFLRTGFLVGQAGILESVAQLVLAYFILAMTVLSICAISTNGALEGGGAYFMISRALGPEFGGSIGCLFFAANVIAAGLYISGFVEGMLENFGLDGTLLPDGQSGLPTQPNEQWWKYLYATIILFLCLIVCIIGGSMFAKTSAFIFLLVILCTLSVFISIFAKTSPFEVIIPKTNRLVMNSTDPNSTVTGMYTGLSSNTFHKNLLSNYTKDYNTRKKMDFASVFAILFSSVTGILNGANMSGELKKPGRSIPRGTICAVMFTFIIYFIDCLMIGGSCDRFLLVNNYNFLQDINLWAPFILIGLFAATLSAALGNLIGASRILEALANDQLFGIFLKPATITTKGGNPYVAVLMSWILVQAVLLVGSLNAIAPAASVFFLLSYAGVNLACLALELASAPNFRPSFKYFTWYTCGAGLLGSMVMCFLISPIYTSVAIIIMLLLTILLHFRPLPTQWGSISQALIFHQVRKYLLMLDPRKGHVKYWRPQIILMVAQPRQSCELIDFINDIKKGGLYVLGHVKVGRWEDHDTDPLGEEQTRWMTLVDGMKIKAFVEITMATSVVEGMRHLVRIAGLGGMKPNTVCLGFYDSSKPIDSLARRLTQKKKRILGGVENGVSSNMEGLFSSLRGEHENKSLQPGEYVQMIEDSLKLQKNVILCRHFHLLNKTVVADTRATSYIDVWPVNLFQPETASFFDNTCLFMLQFACILRMVPPWKAKTQLRVFLCLNAQTDNTLQKEQKLDAYLQQLRIYAKIKIVTWDHLMHMLPQPTEVSSELMQDFHSAPNQFIQEMNELIISHSSRTVVSFLYLPRPPPENSPHMARLCPSKMSVDAAALEEQHAPLELDLYGGGLRVFP
ncbi:Solute carrier family 12 member 9 [Mizuhopecten yessoensis]|uniref:Solute carrier family 12 member 9 n=1 Tax=Mizuhopecten yessoensis TaxID=6573 RepID=A0A210PX42_MIZYE|nr:Solute carrier family 12 member 9 [Mizuhopecten yessoensis]